jgi:hypothetical protein
MSGRVVVESSFPRMAVGRGRAFVCVAVDGARHNVPWGSHEMQLSTGKHVVDVSFQRHEVERGTATVQFSVADGSSTSIQYRAPLNPLVGGAATVME